MRKIAIIAIVNLSRVLSDADVAKALPALQTQIDRDFLPAWGNRAVQAKLVMASLGHIPAGAWPMYLNRHSADPGALGWHTDDGGRVYGRVFVGDCIHYGISWTVDMSHEILEMLADSDAQQVWNMPDGRQASLEVCDAVESDDVGYKIGDVLVSDFVLPAYFSNGPGPFDFCHHLTSSCPALTSGGYMEVRRHGGAWTQIEKDRTDGLRSRRALMTRFRKGRRGLQ